MVNCAIDFQKNIWSHSFDIFKAFDISKTSVVFQRAKPRRFPKPPRFFIEAKLWRFFLPTSLSINSENSKIAENSDSDKKIE